MKSTSAGQDPRTVAGTNLEHARAHNRRAVIETIRLNGQLTRAEIARLTALTPQTVSNIAAELLDGGMLLAGEPIREGARGQPAIPLSINPDGAYSLGIQLDTQSLIAVAVDLAGQCRARVEAPVRRPGPQQALPLIEDVVARLRADSGIDWTRVLGLGLVMPGPFGVEGMSSVGPTTLPGWEEVDAAAELERRLGLPVRLEKDATAAAIGERLYSRAAALRNFVYLFIGAGLGAGLFLDGRLYAGVKHNAGEIGHMIVIPDGRPCDCGNHGCLERYVSLRALYETLGLADDAEQAARSLRRPTPEICYGIERWLAIAAAPRQAVNILESLLDIEAVVIGGFLPADLLEQLEQRLHPLPVSIRHSSGPRVLLGGAGRDTVALGAAALPIFDEFNPQYEVLLKA